MKIFALILAGIVAASSAYGEDFKVGALKIGKPRSHSMVPGAEVGDGYFTITNGGTVADKLISASSSRAAVVQLHEMKVENGIMRMGELKGGLPIPAGQTISLAPNYHLMFMKIGKPFTKGERFSATLVFEKAGSVDVVFDVGNIAGPLDEGAQSSSGSSMTAPMAMSGMNMSK